MVALELLERAVGRRRARAGRVSRPLARAIKCKCGPPLVRSLALHLAPNGVQLCCAAVRLRARACGAARGAGHRVGRPGVQRALQYQHAGQHRDRGQLDRVLSRRAGCLRERPQRCRRRDPGEQQQPADDDLGRRRRRPGDVRLELRRPDAAPGGERAVRWPVLRWPLGRGNGRVAGTEPGRPQYGAPQSAGRFELSLADRVAGGRFLDAVPGVRQRHGDCRRGRLGHLHDGERAGRHRAERFELRWLGARRRLWGPCCAEPQPVGVRRDADRHGLRHGDDPAERVPDAADGTGDLDGRGGRVRGGSGDAR